MREAGFLEELLADRLEEKLEEGLRKGLEQGLQQGLEQGDRRTRLADIQRILRWRFGVVPAQLVSLLEHLTAAQLEPLVDEALEAPDLESFQARVEERFSAR